MGRRFVTALVVGLLLGGWGSQVGLAQGSLSAQVLQLLTRPNTWTAKNSFLDLRLAPGVPSDTANRFYVTNAGALYFNGGLIAGAGGGVSPHNLLSSTHADTVGASVVRGDLVVGSSAPKWVRLPIGGSGTLLQSNGTDVSWSSAGTSLTALTAANLTGTLPAISGVNLLALNATQLTSGVVPLARLSGITFTQWDSNGCTSGQAPVWSGTAWACTAVAAGVGMVTSVALSAPAIFAVGGSPITTSGTLALSLATETANLVWAGPASGAAATPTFRALANADLPLTGVGAGTYTKVTVNTAGVLTAGLAQLTLTTDVAGILPMANGGTGVGVSADDTILVGSGTAWVAANLPNCATGLAYTTGTNLFSCAASGPTHALLSATHSDTAAAAVVRGDVIVGNSTPAWSRLAVGTAGQLFTNNATDPSWSNTLARGTIVTSLPWIFQQTWNAGAVAFTGLQLNMTSSASAATSLIQDWQISGTSVYAVRKDGATLQPGILFANLGTPADGTLVYCSNCLPASSPCTGASTGAFAYHQSGAWKCQ